MPMHQPHDLGQSQGISRSSSLGLFQIDLKGEGRHAVSHAEKKDFS